MKFDNLIPVYGNTDYRGDCPTEAAEQISFVNYVRNHYPNSHGKLIVHIRNEGKRSFQQAARHKAEGMTSGAADIIIPGRVTFVCEMKRKDHTKSQWQTDQKEYLITAAEHGAFVCVALGAKAAVDALDVWLCTTAI